MAESTAATSFSATDAVVVLEKLINEIFIKNTTLINYYIYPEPVPTLVAAYGPRLAALAARISALSRLHMTNFNLLVDAPTPLIAAYLEPTAAQLADAVYGFQKIFIEHYDRGLETKLPYSSIERNLKHIAKSCYEAMQQTGFLAAEEYSSIPSNTVPAFCPAAISFNNDRDIGRLSHLSPSELGPAHQALLESHGGVFLWWECPNCAFRLAYHLSSSGLANINSTDELRPSNVEDVEYRSAWLVKCHLFHPGREEFVNNRRAARALDRAPRPSRSPSPSNASPQQRHFSHRRSSSPSFSFGDNVTRLSEFDRFRAGNTTLFSSHISSSPRDQTWSRRRSMSSTDRNRLPTDTTGPKKLRYGCPFCFAVGHDLDADDEDEDSTCFRTEDDFIEHIDEQHRSSKGIPASLMLQKYKVALDGKTAISRSRWDLNLK